MGVEIVFHNLVLEILVDGQRKPAIIKVTGHIRRKTITALMNGSGAGKRFLINNLCGSAFYGKITENAKINEHDTTIEKNTHHWLHSHWILETCSTEDNGSKTHHRHVGGGRSRFCPKFWICIRGFVRDFYSW